MIQHKLGIHRIGLAILASMVLFGLISPPSSAAMTISSTSVRVNLAHPEDPDGPAGEFIGTIDSTNESYTLRGQLDFGCSGTGASGSFTLGARAFATESNQYEKLFSCEAGPHKVVDIPETSPVSAENRPRIIVSLCWTGKSQSCESSPILIGNAKEVGEAGEAAAFYKGDSVIKNSSGVVLVGTIKLEDNGCERYIGMYMKATYEPSGSSKKDSLPCLPGDKGQMKNSVIVSKDLTTTKIAIAVCYLVKSDDSALCDKKNTTAVAL